MGFNRRVRIQKCLICQSNFASKKYLKQHIFTHDLHKSLHIQYKDLEDQASLDDSDKENKDPNQGILLIIKLL